MAAQRPLSHRNGMKRVGPIWVGIILLGIGAGVVFPVINHFRPREAGAAILAAPAPIDGERAYKYLQDICALGPRIAGTKANTKQREMVSQHFAKHGGKIREQPFSGVDPRSGAKVDMVNLIGSWFPDRRERVVLSAHYDTRPFPDEERDPAKRNLPFIGANDCASGVALLMEIAQHLDKLPTPWGVDLVLFDGEEIVYGGGPNVEGEFFLGSKEFARIYVEGVDSGKLRDRYVAALLFDMIGGSELKIRQEENSVNLAPGLVKEIWAVAKQQKAAAFKPGVGQAVQDDHLPLNNAGIPAIDIIEWPYKYWHTSQDLPKNCSAASLEQVGKVVTAWLAQPKKRTR